MVRFFPLLIFNRIITDLCKVFVNFDISGKRILFLGYIAVYFAKLACFGIFLASSGEFAETAEGLKI